MKGILSSKSSASPTTYSSFRSTFLDTKDMTPNPGTYDVSIPSASQSFTIGLSNRSSPVNLNSVDQIYSLDRQTMAYQSYQSLKGVASLANKAKRNSIEGLTSSSATSDAIGPGSYSLPSTLSISSKSIHRSRGRLSSTSAFQAGPKGFLKPSSCVSTIQISGTKVHQPTQLHHISNTHVWIPQDDPRKTNRLIQYDYGQVHRECMPNFLSGTSCGTKHESR